MNTRMCEPMITVFEDRKLHTKLKTARAEWKRHGGVEAGKFFRDLNADTRR